MKKLLIFIFVLASACMVSCKQSNVETSNDEISNSQISEIGSEHIVKKDGTYVHFGTFTILSKDRVAFDITQVSFKYPSEEEMTSVRFGIMDALRRTINKYNSDYILSRRYAKEHAETIMNDVYNELNDFFAEVPNVNADSIKIVNLFITEHYPSSNCPVTIILK